MNWALLLNSLLVAGGATAVAVAFGLALALFAAGRERRTRGVLLVLAAVALALPPFVVTNCWMDLLGQTGVLRRWLPLNIYSLGGTVWVLALMLWPLPFFAVLGAWQRLEAAQLEADPALAGTALLRWLLLPVAAPALGQAAVLTFVLALNNFAVPAILQVKVFSAEVWLQFSTNFDYAAALRLSVPLVLAPLVLLLWLRRREIAWPRQDGPLAAGAIRRQLGPGWGRVVGALALVVAGLSVVLPLLQLGLTTRSWTELPAALAAGQSALAASLGFAVSAATLTVLAGLGTWRWRLGLWLWLPLFAPGVLLGLALIFVLNRPPFIAVYQSLLVVVIGLVIRYAAIGWHGAALARRSVDPDLVDAAALEGASRWQTFQIALWPQMASSLAAAWFVVYLLCLWDVETLVLIVPPGGETLALRTFNLLHYGHNPQVNALCLLLLAAAGAPLLARLAWRRSGLAGGLLAALVLAGCSRSASNRAALDSRFFSRAEIVGTRGTAPGQFNKPRSVAVDRDDNLYVVDMTGRVQKFSSNGVFLLSWQMPQTDLGKPKGMGRDREGNVIVLEPHYSRVNVFTPAGRLVRQWGVKGTNAGQFWLPRSVAANSRGEIWVCEYGAVERVQRFSADGGKLLLSLGRFGSGAGEFNRAEGLATDAQDRLYVADSCNHRLQVFDPDGRWLASYGRAGTGLGELSYPYDVGVDAAGNQFVCEFGNSRLQVFDPQHRPVEIIGGAGSAPGRFSNPWSLALDSAGNLYVADALNHRVQKLIRRSPAAGGARPDVVSAPRSGGEAAHP
jgi:ABC-type Fe3+ transport system permease subunit/DNA-binding beta-propeller fold protein YncE